MNLATNQTLSEKVRLARRLAKVIHKVLEFVENEFFQSSVPEELETDLGPELKTVKR